MASSSSSVRFLIALLCSTFISRGTSKAQILMYAEGCCLRTFSDRGRPVLFEIGSEREQEILVERSTRSLHGAARIPNVVTPFHYLSGDNHLHRSLGVGPITASSRELNHLGRTGPGGN